MSQHLAYPGAGHIMFVGDPLHLPPSAIQDYNAPRLDGNAGASMAVWRDDWPKTVQFLKESLVP